MDLIVNQVMQLEIVHIANGYRVIKRLAGAPVIKLGLGVCRQRDAREVELRAVLILIFVGFCEFLRHCKALADVILMSTVKYRSADVPAERFRGIS